MMIFVLSTTGWTSRRELSVEAKDSKEDFCSTERKNHSDPRVKEPVGKAGISFFWIGLCHGVISREGTF